MLKPFLAGLSLVALIAVPAFADDEVDQAVQQALAGILPQEEKPSDAEMNQALAGVMIEHGISFDMLQKNMHVLREKHRAGEFAFADTNNDGDLDPRELHKAFKEHGIEAFGLTR